MKWAVLVRRLPAGQIVRFAVVGTLATLTHFLILSRAVDGAGIPAAPANGLAFCGAVTVTYLGQSYWVFARPQHSVTRIRKFLTTAIGGLVANVAVMWLVVDGLRLSYQTGFLLALVTVPALTFVLNRIWVFADRDQT